MHAFSCTIGWIEDTTQPGAGEHVMAFADISRLVRPNRVAVVGASDRPGSLGYSTYNNVRNNSVIAGGAVPVNPRYEAVLGDRCYPRVSDVPGDPIDVAIVLLTAEGVLASSRTARQRACGTSSC